MISDLEVVSLACGGRLANPKKKGGAGLWSVNEITQWVVLAVTLFLMLGLYRQIAIFLNANSELEFSNGPPLHTRIPSKALREVLAKVRLEGGSKLGRATVVAFVTEHCLGCQRLLGGLAKGGASEVLSSSDLALVLVALSPSEGFTSGLEELGVPVIVDDGTLWEMCNIQATPAVIRIDGRGVVVDKKVSNDVQSIVGKS